MDARVDSLAKVLVEHSMGVEPGHYVLIEGQPPAQPLIHAIYRRVLEAGGHPHLLLDLPGREALLMNYGGEAQLDLTPPLRKLAYDTFDARVVIHSEDNTKSLSSVDPKRLTRHRKALQPILQAQMERGGRGEFHWVSTLFPTHAYAQDAEMSLEEYEDFVFQGCHVGEEREAVEVWRDVQESQQRIVDALAGGDRVEVKGPNCELRLSIKGRTFLNACGIHNMPDGEVYTGPVEASVEGWVRFDYPAVWQGRVVEGVELKFEAGQVVEAHASKDEAFLQETLATDAGARYLGEFAIGTNKSIQRFTRRILFDEKIGGTIHMALGAGYPETGSVNKSAVHWDMICSMREDAEIAVDGAVLYRNGDFLL